MLPFSLTLTLSRWEREQPSARFGFTPVRPANPVAGFCVGRDAFLPLPAGEGRGEGERNANQKASQLK